MKTKEEIEQLAKQLCNIPIDLVINEQERYYKNFQKYDGIIQGYIQCQEDMGDTYSFEQIKQAIMFSHENYAAFDDDTLKQYLKDNFQTDKDLNKQE